MLTRPARSAACMFALRKCITHAGVGMDEFEQLMAASAQPNLLDSHEAMSLPRQDADVMTPEPVMHPRHMNALGITPPRSLLSSFTAAVRSGRENSKPLLPVKPWIDDHTPSKMRRQMRPSESPTVAWTCQTHRAIPALQQP